MLSRILDIIQDSFPIAERPYAVLAERLSALNAAEHASGEDSSELSESVGGSDITEQSVFEAVESLRASGVIRRIGGVYDSRKLGYISRLCAGKVPTSELDFSEPRGGRAPTAMETFAAVVNEIPAITHNYVRSHEYNVWFTVIAESEHEVSAIIDRLCAETALRDVHAMAAKRMFKINTVMRQKSASALNRFPDAGLLQCGAAPGSARIPLTFMDKLRIRLLSGDLPHTLTPFADVFATLRSQIQLQSQICEGVLPESLNDFLAFVRNDLASKRMRRLGAILRHQEAGFVHNAMVCFLVDSRQWLVNSENNDAAHCDEKKVSECVLGLDLIAEAGAVLAANPHVSHCYERPPFEGFPYNIYAMFHATSSRDLEEFVESAARGISNRGGQYAVLRSVRELKKTSFSFFCE